MPVTVDDTLLGRIVEIVSKEIRASSSLKDRIDELLPKAKPKQIEAILASIEKGAAYLVRQGLSGKTLELFTILGEMNTIIKQAALTAFSGIRGVPSLSQDSVQRALQEKLSAELEKLETALLFGKDFGVITETENLIIKSLQDKRRVSAEELLEFVRKTASEKVKRQQATRFSAEDADKLLSLVSEGRIYKFQAIEVEKALAAFYDSGDGGKIREVLERVLLSRR